MARFGYGTLVESPQLTPTYRANDWTEENMKYMLLIYGNQETWDALDAVGMENVWSKHRELMAELKASGEFVAADGLTTVCPRRADPGRRTGGDGRAAPCGHRGAGRAA